MNASRFSAVTLGLATIFASALAAAQDALPYEEKRAPRGLGFTVGGGVAGFTDKSMNDFAQPGGTWDARLTVGTRRTVGIEFAYTGTAQNMQALGLDRDAMLVASGAETNLRFNFTTSAWQPFALVGAGWKHYDLTQADFNTSSVNESDNVVEVPVGLGLGYRRDALIIDFRGLFRPAFDGELVGGDTTAMHTWGARLNAGWEF